jgi:ribonuclease HII
VLSGLRLLPAQVLVDGNRLPVLRIPAEAIVQGDATVQSISAASILAKVHRDRLCVELDAAHPQYGFASHKGYSTPEPLEALRIHGASPGHRHQRASAKRWKSLVTQPLQISSRDSRCCSGAANWQ